MSLQNTEPNTPSEEDELVLITEKTSGSIKDIQNYTTEFNSSSICFTSSTQYFSTKPDNRESVENDVNTVTNINCKSFN